MRMYLTFAHWAYWCVFPFKEVLVSNVSVANTKSEEYYFSISYVTCQPLILYTVELILHLIIPRFYHFLSMKLLMTGFRSVYGIFELDVCQEYFFCSFGCPSVSMYTNVTWYLGENDAIIFGKSVHFVKEFCDEELMYFCSVELGGLIWMDDKFSATGIRTCLLKSHSGTLAIMLRRLIPCLDN